MAQKTRKLFGDTANGDKREAVRNLEAAAHILRQAMLETFHIDMAYKFMGYAAERLLAVDREVMRTEETEPAPEIAVQVGTRTAVASFVNHGPLTAIGKEKFAKLYARLLEQADERYFENVCRYPEAEGGTALEGSATDLVAAAIRTEAPEGPFVVEHSYALYLDDGTETGIVILFDVPFMDGEKDATTAKRDLDAATKAVHLTTLHSAKNPRLFSLMDHERDAGEFRGIPVDGCLSTT